MCPARVTRDAIELAAVDLFSDTQTLPSPAMLQAIVEAEVGDEQRGTDPTVIALQERVASPREALLRRHGP